MIVRWLCGGEKRLASVGRSCIQVESEYTAGRPHSRAVGALAGSKTRSGSAQNATRSNVPLVLPAAPRDVAVGGVRDGLAPPDRAHDEEDNKVHEEAEQNQAVDGATDSEIEQQRVSPGIVCVEAAVVERRHIGDVHERCFAL